MNLHSGLSINLTRARQAPTYQVLEKSLDTDVVILGGGISGAFMAYYLIKAGIKCAVSDGRAIGLGSTCASTALLQYEIDTPLSELQNLVGFDNAVKAYKLCENAIHDIENIAKTIGYNDFKFVKSLYYATKRRELRFLNSEFNIRKANGFDVKLLSKQEIKDQFNINAPAAILSQCAGQINALTFTHALHQYGIKNGLQVYSQTMVDNVAHKPDRVVLQTQNGNTITAKKIIYATGYESIKLIDKQVVKLHCTFVTISEKIKNISNLLRDDVLMWNTANPYFYMRITEENRIIIGGRDEDFHDPVKRDALIKEKEALLIQDFNELYPDIIFKPEFSWAGTFGATIDGLPFIGEYSNMPNSYFSLGFGGNGITFSVIAAQIITDLIEGKKNKDAFIFSFDRIKN